jgi:hypothetical protein
MRALKTIGVVLLVGLSGCGLEGFFGNITHSAYDRPASKIKGRAPFDGAKASALSVATIAGAPQSPFQATIDATGNYELRLPSSQYPLLRTRYRAANADLRIVVAGLGAEGVASAMDFDAEQITEGLIFEARLSADGKIDADGNVTTPISPAAFLGLRALVRQDFQNAGPAKDLLEMVRRLLTNYDRFSLVNEAHFFRAPVVTKAVDGSFTVTSSPLDNSWLVRYPFDYAGLGTTQASSLLFDQKLAEVASTPLYDPAGCPDPNQVRLVFTVDFRAGQKNGSCSTADRFKWTTDKPGKQMFFVGWVHEKSAIQDPATNTALGASTPNTVPMYDDGTNGDEVPGDSIWTVTFDVPRRDPAAPADTSKVLRIGYKYTWGTQGVPWTGTEEWPGNSRILEVVDDNGDDIVYRRDVYGDESTNKDNANLYSGRLPPGVNFGGSIDWPTDLHGCGVPESHENKYDNATCTCGPYPAPPKGVGPINVACTAP